MTTPAEAKTILRDSFRAHWVAAGEDPLRLEWPNSEFDRKGLPYFVRPGFLHAPQPTRELGGGDQFFAARGGTLQIEIYVRLGEDDDELDRLSEIVLEWLETFGVGIIRFYDPGINDIGPNGGWFQANGEAVWEYDTVRDVV